MHVLYLTQTGLAEPLGRSQVVPYLCGLTAAGHRFTVVSFERTDDLGSGRSGAVTQRLPPQTRWIRLKYHGNPPLASTVYDVLHGMLRAGLVRGVDLIHARSTVPALAAAGAGACMGVPWVFDVRGFVAQEYVDAGHWRKGSWRARVTSRLERHLIRGASGRVFLTQRARHQLEKQGLFTPAAPTAVIPCSVDLERFARSEASRVARRRELGIDDGTLLSVYSGSLGNWNLAPELFRFQRALSEQAATSRILVLTRNADVALREAQAAGLASSLLVRTVSPDEVPSYLSAADIGIAFATSLPSRVASSPTKIAEYLACGLPVVTNSGVGDICELEGEASIVVVPAFDDDHLRAAASDVLGRRQPGIHGAARGLAERRFSLADAVCRYDTLYRLVWRAEGRSA